MKGLKARALQIAVMPLNYKKKFLRVLFGNISEKQRQSLLEYVVKMCYQDRYQKINSRLETIFAKNPSVKPSVAARMVSYYFRIPGNMMPLVLKLSQKAKDRVRKRNKT